jgi:hypothetical protein
MDLKANLESLKELESQISKRIDDFNSKRHRLKNWRNLLVIGQIVFATLTTLFVAINIKFNIVLISILAIVFSALSTLTGTFLSQFQFHERLISHINTVSNLRELKSRLKLHKMKAIDNENNYKIAINDVEIYFEELQRILNIANSEWQKLINNNKLRMANKDDIIL